MSSQAQNPSTRLRPFRATTYGRYTLLMPLSTGGMGEIFLARLEGEQGFEKRCVIKRVLPHLAQDNDFVARFVHEARVLSKLSHGSIAQVLDMGQHEGSPYLALEFIDGKDLRRVAARMRDRKLPVPLTFTLYVMGRVLDALAYAHRKRDDDGKELGLVHRDVSPQNILISYEGEVKVIDFGLARSTINVAKTNPSIVLGKFLYMSPEQARHAGVDKRSDLYAVGLCLYELICGKSPFDAVPPGELMAQVASPQIAPLHEVEPLCPPAVAQLVSRALALKPEDRFQTAEEFRGKLLAALLEIDPNAGPEAAGRFMHQAFAIEYGAERKMFASLAAQAGTTPATPAAPAAEPEPPATNVRPLKKPAVEEPAPHKADTLKPEPLSFKPTPKPPRSASTVMTRDALPMASATPSVVVDGSVVDTLPPDEPGATEQVRGNAVKARAAALAAEPQTELPNVVVSDAAQTLPAPGGALEGLLEDQAPMLPAPHNRLRTQPDLEPVAKSAPAKKQKAAAAPTVPLAAPAASVAPSRAPEPAAAVVEALPRALETRPPPAMSDTGSKMKGGRRASLVWVLLPLVAILGVAGYIGLDLMRDGEHRQLEEENARRNSLGRPTGNDNRSRELKVTPPPEPPKPVAVEEDLAALPEGVKKRPAPRPATNLSKGQRAFAEAKANFNKLNNANASTAQKLKMEFKLLTDEAERSTSGTDDELAQKAAALNEKVKQLLKDPENQ